jgi:hypothetical protein
MLPKDVSQRHFRDFAGVVGALLRPLCWAREATLLHSAADLIDLEQADALEQMASVAVA